MIMNSFASFLLVNEELRGVEHGERESKVGQNGRFRSIFSIFLTHGFYCDELCLSDSLNKLSLIEEPSTRMNSC